MAAQTTDRSRPGAPPQGGRISELDGLRGLAILSVLYWHYAATPRALSHGFSHALFRAGLFAWSGVDLFFVLSGFLIGGILVDERDSPTFFRPFYARRFFRIVPLYAVLCIAGTAVVSSNAGLAPILGKPMPFAIYLGFLQDFWLAHHGWDAYMGVTWSLAVEEQFYVIFPLIVRYVRRLLPAVLALIVASVLVRTGLYLHYGPEWGTAAYTIAFCRADALLLGVLGALMIRNPELAPSLPRIVPAATALSGLGVLVMFAKGWTMQTRPMSTLGYTCLALLYLSLLLWAVTRDGLWARFLRASWLRRLGKVAYCLYLVHGNTLAIAHFVFPGRELLSEVTGLALALALSELSWRFLESEMIRLGHRFTYTPVPPVPAPGLSSSRRGGP